MSVSHGTLLLPASGYQLDLSEPELLQAAPLGSRLAWRVSQYAPTLVSSNHMAGAPGEPS